MENRVLCKLFKSALFAVLAVLIIACSKTKRSNNKEKVEGLKVVSLAPSITKELIYLGVEDQIVGITSYCTLAKTKPELVVGSAIDINIERILLLKPDIVIATGLTKGENIETLESNGVKVYTVGKLDSYQEICHELLAIGKMVERQQEAARIIQTTNEKIDSLRQTIQTNDSLSLFFQIGAKPLFAVIPNTFMDDLISFAKCKNIAFDMQHGTVSRETVINRNPDVIYVATMGIVGEEEKQIWESYKDLSAVKNKKVLVIDSNMACTPSVIAFYNSLEQMIQEIYN